MEEKITQQQMYDASNYLESFFKFAGMRYPADIPRTEEDMEKAEKTWPKDALAAMDTIGKYWSQMAAEGIKP